MKELLTYRLLFIILIFMSFSLPGGSINEHSVINSELQIKPEVIQDSLVQERLKNIDRLEKMKYVVQQLAD